MIATSCSMVYLVISVLEAINGRDTGVYGYLKGGGVEEGLGRYDIDSLGS